MQYNMVQLPSKRSHIQKCLECPMGMGGNHNWDIVPKFYVFWGESPKEKRSEKKDQNKEKKLHKFCQAKKKRKGSCQR